jgi:dipeptidyl aminopeptidase/acylaminoacyl peptidase
MCDKLLAVIEARGHQTMIFKKNWLSVLLLGAVCWGCDTYFHAPVGPKSASAGESETRRRMLEVGRVVLERDEKGILLAGEAEAVRVGTDALRVIVLDTAPEGLELEGMRVLDARMVEDGAVVLGADRVLRHHTEDGVRELDDAVLGPLSVEGGMVAYVRGAAPDLRLRRVDLATGEVESLAPEIAPVWSPALSADGREVIFAASRSGRPELLRLDAEGELDRISSGGRSPSSPVAPVWRGGLLIFEDEAGRARLNLVTGEVEEEAR